MTQYYPTYVIEAKWVQMDAQLEMKSEFDH